MTSYWTLSPVKHGKNDPLKLKARRIIHGCGYAKKKYIKTLEVIHLSLDFKGSFLP